MIRLLMKFLQVMNKIKTIKFILEIVKYIVTALLGYYGGNAIV